MIWSRQARLLTMFCMTGVLFVVELVVGYAVGSIALVADSFHMLSDLMSLGVAMYAIRLAAQSKSRWKPHLTYGWQRAEVLGALINGVFLLALCFMIFIEAMQRFFEPVIVERPVLVLIVGSIGLVVNILGLFIFHEHSGHSHDHSHDHSHSHSHSHDHSHQESVPSTDNEFAETQLKVDGITPYMYAFDAEESATNDSSNKLNPTTQVSVVHDEHNNGTPPPPPPPPPPSKRLINLNMHGVFLHVLGDAMGSVAVIISGLIIWLTPWSFRFYFDPIISLLITCIILVSTVPLVRKACHILLQGTPSSVSMRELRVDLAKLPNVIDIHELHVWQLSDTKLIASVHVVCRHQDEFMTIAVAVKKLLHGYGIHSATVQPEFVDMSARSNQDDNNNVQNRRGFMSSSHTSLTLNPPEVSCQLRCEDDACFQDECCAPDTPLVQDITDE